MTPDDKLDDVLRAVVAGLDEPRVVSVGGRRFIVVPDDHDLGAGVRRALERIISTTGMPLAIASQATDGTSPTIAPSIATLIGQSLAADGNWPLPSDAHAGKDTSGRFPSTTRGNYIGLTAQSFPSNLDIEAAGDQPHNRAQRRAKNKRERKARRINRERG